MDILFSILFSNKVTIDIIVISIISIFTVYGVIAGQAKTFKTILSIYPSFFIADTLGGFLPKLFPNLKVAFINNQDITTFTLSEQTDSLHVILITKIIIFLIFWFLIAFKSPFYSEIKENSKKLGSIIISIFLSISLGILFVNVFLILLSGFSIFGLIPSFQILEEIMTHSFLVNIFIKFSGLWFALPAITLALSGFLHKSEQEQEISDNEAEEELE